MATPQENKKARQRRYYERNRHEINLRHRDRRAAASPAQKERERNAKSRWAGENPDKRKASRIRNYTNRVFNSARNRARRDGIPFEIEQSDIIVPQYCPVDGGPIIPLSDGPRSPSLDRLVAGLGYVPGNIVVVSQSANSIKGDRSLAQLRALAAKLEARAAAVRRVVEYMQRIDGAINDGLEVLS